MDSQIPLSTALLALTSVFASKDCTMVVNSSGVPVRRVMHGSKCICLREFEDDALAIYIGGVYFKNHERDPSKHTLEELDDMAKRDAEAIGIKVAVKVSSLWRLVQLLSELQDEGHFPSLEKVRKNEVTAEEFEIFWKAFIEKLSQDVKLSKF